MRLPNWKRIIAPYCILRIRIVWLSRCSTTVAVTNSTPAFWLNLQDNSQETQNDKFIFILFWIWHTMNEASYTFLLCYVYYHCTTVHINHSHILSSYLCFQKWASICLKLPVVLREGHPPKTYDQQRGASNDQSEEGLHRDGKASQYDKLLLSMYLFTYLFWFFFNTFHFSLITILFILPLFNSF